MTKCWKDGRTEGRKEGWNVKEGRENGRSGAANHEGQIMRTKNKRRIHSSHHTSFQF